jgi:hypothetical protein
VAVFSAVANVFTAIAPVLAPIPAIFAAIEPSADVARVTPIFTTVAPILPLVAAILASIPSVFNAIPPAALWGSRKRRRRGQHCENQRRDHEFAQSSHHVPPSQALVLRRSAAGWGCRVG